MDSYLTIEGPSEGVYRQQMSRFLAYAFPVQTAAEARQHIADLQKQYHDARHVCWAYTIGTDSPESMSNDNGEPSGTAGRPILGQITSHGLTNVVVIVVRYFGGIKLGTSGLIGAYREAARLALEDAQIVERHREETLSFAFPYEAMNGVMRLTKNDEVRVLSREFGNTCFMTVAVRADLMPALRKGILGLDGVTER